MGQANSKPMKNHTALPTQPNTASQPPSGRKVAFSATGTAAPTTEPAPAAPRTDMSR